MIQSHSFTPPCTVGEFQASLLQIYLHSLRQASLMVPHERWSKEMHPRLVPQDLWKPELEEGDIGVTVDEIQGSEFVRAMKQQYQLAAYGFRVPGISTMHYESIHMWVAAWLVELSSSAFVVEWDSYGCNLSEHVTRCLVISELANARQVLDGQESFSHFYAPGLRDQHKVEFGELSVRQMALLSGMEEMSVRTAASRKGPSQLITHKNKDGRTVVSIENAKAWLKGKGKYVEVVARWDWEALDLAKSRFETPQDIGSALRSHCDVMSERTPGRNFLAEATALFARHGMPPVVELDPAASENPQLLRELAELLELPAELFSLRVRECMLRFELARIGLLIQRTPAQQA